MRIKRVKTAKLSLFYDFYLVKVTKKETHD